MNLRMHLFWSSALLLAMASAQNEADLKADLASGDRKRILSAIVKVQEGKIAELFPDVLAAFSASDDSLVRRQAIFLMSRAGAPQVPEMVRQAIDDPKEPNLGNRHLGARELALQKVLRTNDRTVIVKAIRTAIADEDVYYRKYGAAALAGYPEAHEEFSEAVEFLATDPSPAVQAMFLSKLKMSHQANRALRAAAESADPIRMIAGAYGLSRDPNWFEYGRKGMPGFYHRLQSRLGSDSEVEAAAAAAAWSFLWNVREVPRESFDQPENPRARVMTAAFFRERGADFDAEFLRRVLEEGTENDQLRAVALLSEMASLEAIPLLEFAATEAKSPDVRKSAVFGLRAAGWIAEFSEMGKKPNGRAVSTLVLKPELSEEERKQKAAAVSALEKLASGDDAVISKFALDAIGRITGATEAIPPLIDHELWLADLESRSERKIAEVAGQRIPPGAVLEIGNQKQLFIDDFAIESSSGVTRKAHPFQKHPANPVFHAQMPWEENWVDNFMCSVHYDEATRQFKMWYRCGANHTLGAYAVSEDGISWQRPNLGRVNYLGSTENNLLGWKEELYRDAHQPGHNISIMAQNDPAKRYLSFFGFSGEKRGFYVSYSPDGLKWSEPEHAQMVYGDVATLLPDPEGGFLFFPKQARWVDGYRRSFGFAQLKTEKAYAPKTYPFTTLTEKHDALVGREAAESFGILAPRTLNPADGAYYSNWHTQIYSVTPIIYEGLVLGFYDLWYLTGKKEGPLEMLCMATRDRKNWFDVGYPDALLPRGRAGEWDAGMVYGGSNILVIDDEIRFYYSGFNLGHYTDIPWGSKPHQIMGVGLATLRLDGFVSMRAESGKVGEILTKPLKLAGERLEINADASGGTIRVEVLDAEGKTLPGFAASDCVPVRADGLRTLVSWKNGDLAALANRTVKLRFVLNGADLFAFQVR